MGLQCKTAHPLLCCSWMPHRSSSSLCQARVRSLHLTRPSHLPAPARPHGAQVVSGDEGGTICMWNLQSGRREGGFQLWATPSHGGGTATGAAPVAQPKLTAMAFDANQRRLLTASDAGAVRCYNFNSGAVLREFVAAKGDRRELTAVAFVPPPPAPAAEEEEGEERGDGAGCAAAVEDEQAENSGGGDGYSELSEHALMLHQQEQSMAAQRASQQHAAAHPPSGSQTSRSRASSAGSVDGPPPLVLASGWGRSLCVWEESEEERVTRCHRLAGHQADVLCMVPLGRDVVATGVLLWGRQWEDGGPFVALTHRSARRMSGHHNHAC